MSTFVFIRLNEIIKALPECFKYKAHVVADIVFVDELLLEIDYAVLRATFISNILQDICFYLCTLIVPLDSANHLILFK